MCHQLAHHSSLALPTHRQVVEAAWVLAGEFALLLAELVAVLQCLPTVSSMISHGISHLTDLLREVLCNTVYVH
jgi:hypothetical protein